MLEFIVGLWLLFGRNNIMDLAVAIAKLDILGPSIVFLAFSLSLEVGVLYFSLDEMFD